MPIAEVGGPQASWDLVADWQLLTAYPFMQHALAAGTLVAILAGLMGYVVVLRGQSFAGHSLANVGFAGATGAALWGAAPVMGLFLAGALAATGIHVLSRGGRQSRYNDLAVGAVLTAALALGYLFVFLTPSADGGSVYTVLFGNPLGISARDVRTIGVVTLLGGGLLLGLARPLLFASIDPEVAAARGVPVRALSLTFLLLLALVVAVTVQIIGVLLIFALLVTPGAIASDLAGRPLVAMGVSAIISVVIIWLGLAMAYFSQFPVGFCVTSLAFAAFLLGRLSRWLARQRTALVTTRANEVAT